MSKVLLDGNLIDLEMITYITQPKEDNYDDEDGIWGYSFFIYMVGGPGRYIRITRSTENPNDKNFTLDKVKAMYEALIQRWSPSMIKFDDLTVR